jgi:hypothetical protein
VLLGLLVLLLALLHSMLLPMLWHAWSLHLLVWLLALLVQRLVSNCLLPKVAQHQLSTLLLCLWFLILLLLLLLLLPMLNALVLVAWSWCRIMLLDWQTILPIVLLLLLPGIPLLLVL